ncbi:hypothetical protein [Brenneria izbisi]|uniref:Uncharacterized protein n=1 Tax=Brenneria izbisi TaxID=2939450 RepID=A0AA41Y7B0_9GAMM|nr:hypothetical protein [Brenneria izbisi]MCV9880651.1 hypothetical protein [Brenneria izbisi]MCV9884072.1 hypothetical protein [Brenneria izbisi]
MKLINPLKSNQSVNLNTLIMLIIRCVLCIFFMAMIGCFLGRLIVFLKANILFFDWKKDVFYSLKVGASAGTLAGIGIWIKAKLQERKARKESAK